MTAPASSYDYLFKLLLIGDSAVGKTNLLLSFTGNVFDEDAKSTIGVDLKLKVLKLREKTVKLTLWDTAGQERFRTLTSAYYRGAQGIILVFDVTRRETFQNIKEWIKEVDLYTTSDQIVKMLVGNKIDLESERTVTAEEGRDLAREHGMLFIQTSAKTNTGVSAAFEELVLKIMDNPVLIGDVRTASAGGRGVVLDSQDNDNPDSCAC